jgi:hypothetical protein
MDRPPGNLRGVTFAFLLAHAPHMISRAVCNTVNLPVYCILLYMGMVLKTWDTQTYEVELYATNLSVPQTGEKVGKPRSVKLCHEYRYDMDGPHRQYQYHIGRSSTTMVILNSCIQLFGPFSTFETALDNKTEKILIRTSYN